MKKFYFFIMLILLQVFLFCNGISFRFDFSKQFNNTQRNTIHKVIDVFKNHFMNLGVYVKDESEDSLFIIFERSLEDNIIINVFFNNILCVSNQINEANYKDISYRIVYRIVEIIRFNALIKSYFENEIIISTFDSVYEYIYKDFENNYITFISDKYIGNTNPFIINTEKFKELYYTIEETSEAFPTIIGDKLYFLQIEIDNTRLYSISIDDYYKNREKNLILSEAITCLRKWGSKLYFSTENEIYTLDENNYKQLIYSGENYIQSFDINGGELILSLLKDNHFNLYRYNLSEKKLSKITNENGHNEMDIRISQDGESYLYSANYYGIFNIYIYSSIGDCIIEITKNKTDEFYPSFISENIVIFSRYENRKEPYLVGKKF